MPFSSTYAERYDCPGLQHFDGTLLDGSRHRGAPA